MRKSSIILFFLLLFLKSHLGSADFEDRDKDDSKSIRQNKETDKEKISKDLSNIEEIYNRRYYYRGYELLQRLENQTADKKRLPREFYVLKSELLIKLNKSDSSIDASMENMIKKDPTVDYTINDNSSLFYNRFSSYNIYPNLKVGLGTTFSFISISSDGELPVVYQSQKGSNREMVSPENFSAIGINAFVSYYPLRHFGLKLDFTQNFNTELYSSYNLDNENEVKITESMDSRVFSLTTIWNLASLKSESRFVNSLSTGLGYQAFNLNKSTSKYELSTSIEGKTTIKYSNDLETSEYREQLVHNLLFGLQYEPEKFIENKRIRLILGVQFVFGISDFNSPENRLENQVLNNLYYYAEDRFNMRSIQFQIQIAYNALYHRKKYK